MYDRGECGGSGVGEVSETRAEDEWDEEEAFEEEDHTCCESYDKIMTYQPY